ncbi:MAG: polysaccharide biosynthesis tyrosine autokinase [Abditibacteriales bacterium]|nr:polysaccharide biosynthesis tyrosine autokinase [Abditibacteriales bacterium]MDW8364395.1 polysaccharide biosynthesis tyrosine autokinase [Abditibacteriales bacterium]
MNSNGHYLVSNLSPQSPYTEAYRIARTNLLAYPASLRTIMVTSARSGQGKSTVATNLGIVTAQMGRRVIVVEGDMRRPVLHRFFALKSQPGLAEVLKGEATLSEALQPTSIENLFFLASGTPPSHPAELLGSRAMRDLLDNLRAQADMIFIDTPPVSAFSDPLILSRQVDAVILAYRARQVPREVDVRARAQLEAMQANVLGIILTNVEPDVCDSYYYHYTYYESKRSYEKLQSLDANGEHATGALSAPLELEVTPVGKDEQSAQDERVATAVAPSPSEAPAGEAVAPETAATHTPVAPEFAESEPVAVTDEVVPESAEDTAVPSDGAEMSTEVPTFSESVSDEKEQQSLALRRLRLSLMFIVVVALLGVVVYFLLSQL